MISWPLRIYGVGSFLYCYLYTRSYLSLLRACFSPVGLVNFFKLMSVYFFCSGATGLTFVFSLSSYFFYFLLSLRIFFAAIYSFVKGFFFFFY